MLCKLCGHSASTECAEKPEHEYVEYTHGRVTPLAFRQRLLSALPTVVALPLDVNLVRTAAACVNAELLEPWLTQVLPLPLACHAKQAVPILCPHGHRFFGRGSGCMQLSLIASCEFRFSETIRAEAWRVIFRDPTERLSLVLTLAADGAEWHVHVQPPSERTELRKWLELPLLRMRCSRSTLLEGEWQVRLPVEQISEVTILGKGELVDSFQAAFGIERFANERRWSQLHVKFDCTSVFADTDVSGTYELLPKCFGALGSLHKRKGTGGERPLYFFLDPKSVGAPDGDSFVFAHDWRRLVYAQTRTSTVLTLDCKFRAKADPELQVRFRLACPPSP